VANALGLGRQHTAMQDRRDLGCPERDSSTERPLYGLKAFSIATGINDLPVISPHGCDSSAIRKFLKLHQLERSQRHSNGTLRQ
jgi:hypothetical protein